MGRLSILAITLAFVGIAMPSRTVAVPQQSPRDVVENYRRLDMNGRWLGGQHRSELQEFFTGPIPPVDWSSAIVVKNYLIGSPRKLTNDKGQAYYRVEVTYSRWGSLDKSLVFRYSTDSSPEKPARTLTVSLLVLTDKFQDGSSQAGETVEKSVPLQWRMSSGQLNYVSVDAAVQYVTEMRSKSQDPVVRDNADRTLAELKALQGENSATFSRTLTVGSPVDVLRRVWALGESGAGLSADGWNEQTEYFAIRPVWPWKRIAIIGNNPISNFEADLNAVGDLADFTVSYAKVGYLDSSMRLKLAVLAPCGTDPDSCVSEAAYTFRLSRQYWQEETDGSLKPVTGALAWRIISADPPVPWITVDAAIQYVADIRDKTKDGAVKANAETSLAILKHYR